MNKLLPAVATVTIAAVGMAGCGGSESAQDFADTWFEQVGAADSAACDAMTEPEAASIAFQDYGYIYPDGIPSEGASCEEFLDAATVQDGMDSATVTITDETETEASGDWSYDGGEVTYSGTFDLTKSGEDWQLQALSQD